MSDIGVSYPKYKGKRMISTAPDRTLIDEIGPVNDNLYKKDKDNMGCNFKQWMYHKSKNACVFRYAGLTQQKRN